MIVVAGGSGIRFGGEPKQFLPLGDRSVLDWSLDVASSFGDGLVVVLPPSFIDRAKPDNGRIVVAGGATRSESVRAGLAAVPDDADVIVVHDAARPLATKGLFFGVMDAVLQGADAAVPGVAIADTLKRVGTRPTQGAMTEVIETIDREQLVAVQTPQAFRADVLRRAHAALPEASDDAGLVEALGCKVVVVPGEMRNFKITLPDDLLVANELVAHAR